MTLGYAAMPNSSPMKCACPTASPLANHLTLPFRILATVSIPCKCSPGTLKGAVALGQPHPLFYRAMILFYYVVEVLTLAQANPPREHTFGFQPRYGGGICGILVHVHDPGAGLPREARALRRNRLAAAASRLAVSRKSIVWPVESTARYRYLSSPLTFIYVSWIR